MPNSGRFMSVVIVGMIALGAQHAVEGCCSRGFKVCGPAGIGGTVATSFTVGLCTAAGDFAVLPGATAQDVCLALKAALDGDCCRVPPCTKPCGACQPCTFACYPVDAGCWVLADSDNCISCDTIAPATTCCGITIEAIAG